ncbi:MAG: TrkA family potassium uptake protein [Chloroflexales bacterium]|nr:TrkA family potassium uptake protein [Chloroflexales bacterium]
MARRNGKKEFAVIGLGRFGTSLAMTLMEQGFHVLGIDRDTEIVQRLSDQITQAVSLDSTNEDALSAVDIISFDTVVVAIGNNFEGNLMTTVALKSLGVKHVVCKALTERQQAILLRVGADRVVLPEHEAGQRLAWVLAEPRVLDHLELGPGFSVAELRVPPSMVEHTLIETDMRRRYGINVLAVRRGSALTVSPPVNYIFEENDILLVIGADTSIARFCELS